MCALSRFARLATVAGCFAANAGVLLCQPQQSSMGAQDSPAQGAAGQSLPAQSVAVQGVPCPVLPVEVLLNNYRIQFIGRIDDRNPLKPRLAYPGTEIRLRLHGGSMRLVLSSDSDKSALTIVVDHGAPRLQLLHLGLNDLTLSAAPAEGDHTFEIMKRTETWQGILTVESISLPPDVILLPPPIPSQRKLMFVGDSVTCGTGVNNNAICKADPENPSSDVYNSYGLLLGRRLDAETHLVCYGGRGLVRDYRGLGIEDHVLNAPQFFPLAVAADALSGRVAWDATRFQPDAIVFSLGTNDFSLQKTKPLDEPRWIDAYVGFLRSARALYPQAKFLVTEGAIVTDPLLRSMLQQVVAQAADPLASYVPSQHYPGNGCDGHPTASQHLQMTDDFEPILRARLGW
jgi:lysophospholipase L1-like esterase